MHNFFSGSAYVVLILVKMEQERADLWAKFIVFRVNGRSCCNGGYAETVDAPWRRMAVEQSVAGVFEYEGYLIVCRLNPIIRSDLLARLN